MKGKFYQGRRRENDIFVHVKKENDPWFKPLPHIEFHSPDGFEWGYPGSGPADLALAILADFFDEDPEEVRTYAFTGKGELSQAFHAHQEFKQEFIEDLPRNDNSWRIYESQIKEWFYSKIGAICKDCKRGMYESDGCMFFPILLKDGSTEDPLTYGQETRADFAEHSERCHDCGAKKGKYHHPGCDVEECPSCGRQLIGCDCQLVEDSDGLEGVPLSEDEA